jgi:hypothetical protein
MSVNRGNHVNAFFNLLPDLSLLPRRHALSGPGNNPADILYDPDHARHPGNCHCAAGTNYAVSSTAFGFHPTSPHCPVDVAVVAVRFRNWCHCLFNALSFLSDTSALM